MRRLLLVALMLAPAGAMAVDGPVPPCGSRPVPDYPALTAAPETRFLHLDGREAVWTPPDCLDWTLGAPALVLGLAARFAFAGTTDELLARLGAVSALRGLRYWSVTDRAWREFITDAAALTNPDARQRRPDFEVDELRRGENLYFSQSDSRSSEPVVYRSRLREARANRIVFEFENVSAVHFLQLIPIYDPGDIRMTIFLDRISEGVWGYYSMSAVRETPRAGSEASFANRTAAYFRHVAGIATAPSPPPPLMISEGVRPAPPTTSPVPAR